MRGLTPNTANVIERISELECLKPFVLVGGTALALQIGKRNSEDLDFMRWRRDKKDNLDIEWNKIKDQLAAVGDVQETEIFDLNHVVFVVDGVKLSFYASPNYSILDTTVPFLNNIVLADIPSIGAMKMEVLMRRSTFRDYYDIYSILKEGYSIDKIIERALKYSGHRLKSKNLLMMLTSSERFALDDNFDHLSPEYHVSPQEIEAFIREKLTADAKED